MAIHPVAISREERDAGHQGTRFLLVASIKPPGSRQASMAEAVKIAPEAIIQRIK